MAVPDGATALGNYFYLFKSSLNTTDCLISAHGGYVKENRAFTVPTGVSVQFYGEHGAALLDPDITKFVKVVATAETVETFSGGQRCNNYLLSKYQGAHAGESGTETVETYEQIIASIRGEESYVARKRQQLERAKATMKAGLLQEIASCFGASILTVRNRWNVFYGMTLESAIKAARKEMPSLTTFHAVFCRSNMMGDDPKPAQSVKARKPS